MPLNRNQARKLCTAAEYALVEASLADAIGSLKKAALRSHLGRARRVRDKFRDLAQRQTLATRARTGVKGGATGDANLRTAQKARLFAEVVVRFETRMEKVEAAEQRAAARAAAAKLRAEREKKAAAARKQRDALRARKAKATAAKKKVAAKGGFVSPKAEAANQARQFAKARSRPIQAHISARGKRDQAKRDRR